MVAFVIGLLAPAAGALAATSEVFGGPLGSWLRAEAIPEFTALLGQHPRFKGERIRVVGMQDGVPVTQSNALGQALRSELTNKLTRIKGVQIAWQAPSAGCGVPLQAPYLLGVEVIEERRGQVLVRIAMVDVEEGVWVSGAHQQWRGALTLEERRALATPLVDAPAGTIDAPLASRNIAKIAGQLEQQIACALRGGLDGDVTIVTADSTDRFLGSLKAELEQRLVRGAIVGLAEDNDAAEWEMRLQQTDDVGTSVIASLRARTERPTDRSVADPEASAQTDSPAGQRLGQVYVQGLPTATTEAIARAPAAPQKPKNRVAAAPLIEDLRAVPARVGDPCYARSAECVEVRFELSEPSYLLVLRTENSGSVTLGSCEAVRKTAGTKRFRLQRDPTGAAFYALATADLALARELHNTLARAASNCDSARDYVNDQSLQSNWLDDIEDLLANQAARFDWQAYFTPGSGEPEADSSAVAVRDQHYSDNNDWRIRR